MSQPKDTYTDMYRRAMHTSYWSMKDPHLSIAPPPSNKPGEEKTITYQLIQAEMSNISKRKVNLQLTSGSAILFMESFTEEDDPKISKRLLAKSDDISQMTKERTAFLTSDEHASTRKKQACKNWHMDTDYANSVSKKQAYIDAVGSFLEQEDVDEDSDLSMDGELIDAVNDFGHDYAYTSWAYDKAKAGIDISADDYEMGDDDFDTIAKEYINALDLVGMSPGEDDGTGRNPGEVAYYTAEDVKNDVLRPSALHLTTADSLTMLNTVLDADDVDPDLVSDVAGALVDTMLSPKQVSGVSSPQRIMHSNPTAISGLMQKAC